MNALTLLRRILWAAGGLMGLVAVVRMFLGPFEIARIPVNAPLNPEGFFGLAMTIVLTWRGANLRPGEATPPPARAALAAGGTMLIAVVSQFRVVDLYFLSDDFILVQQANRWMWSNLIPVFTSGGGDGFFRPVGLVSLAINATWAGTDPRLWHASAAGLHAINALLVAWLAARLGLSTRGAFLAGALFALHGAHLEAAAWIAGRFDLLAVFFTLTGMLLFTVERWWAGTASLVCCLCAVFSKEAAFLFPLLLLPVALLRRRALRSTAPFFVVTALAFAYRWIMQGGIGGYVSPETGQAAAFSLGLATTAKAVAVRLWTSLYFPINWSADPQAPVAALTVTMVAAVLWLAARSRPAPLFRFGLAALLVSILPPLHLLGGAADLSGGRLLYLPAVWFCLMLAAAVEGTSGKTARTACGMALLVFQWAALHHNLDSWETASRQVREICTAASEGIVPSDLPRDIQGVPALANGFQECVELAPRIDAK